MRALRQEQIVNIIPRLRCNCAYGIEGMMPESSRALRRWLSGRRGERGGEAMVRPCARGRRRGVMTARDWLGTEGVGVVVRGGGKELMKNRKGFGV